MRVRAHARRRRGSGIGGLRLTMCTLSEDYELRIRQGPERARVAGVKEKGAYRRGPDPGDRRIRPAAFLPRSLLPRPGQIESQWTHRRSFSSGSRTTPIPHSKWPDDAPARLAPIR